LVAIRYSQGPERRAALEATEVLPRAQKRLLHQILRLVERAQHPVAVHPQLPAMTLDEHRERALIARPCGGHDRILATHAQRPPSAVP